MSQAAFWESCDHSFRDKTYFIIFIEYYIYTVYYIYILNLPSYLLAASPYLCVCVWVFSGVQLFVTPWAVVHQAPWSVGFYKQEY